MHLGLLCSPRFVGVFLSALGGALQYWRDRREAEDEWAQWAPDIFHHYGFQAVGAGVPRKAFSVVGCSRQMLLLKSGCLLSVRL